VLSLLLKPGHTANVTITVVGDHLHACVLLPLPPPLLPLPLLLLLLLLSALQPGC
jgi:hypothetical protein